MLGSILSHLMETACGEEVVNHMLSEKAVSLSLRKHFLIKSEITKKLMQGIFLSRFAFETSDNE